jgi:hypothetical protein
MGSPGKTNVMEQEILQMLQQSAGVLHSAKELGRRIDRDQFKDNPNWARPFLDSLVRQHSIQEDETGYYYYPVSAKLGSR